MKTVKFALVKVGSRIGLPAESDWKLYKKTAANRVTRAGESLTLAPGTPVVPNGVRWQHAAFVKSVKKAVTR